MKRMLLSFLVLVFFLGAGFGTAEMANADYSHYLTVRETEKITGLANLTLKSMDSKKSGEAYDLTYLTADGEAVMMIQVLRGSDYEMFYQQFRCQDYRPMEYAFWGPKDATPENPPSQLWFRKGDSLIFIESGYNSSKKTFLNAEMMENVAKTIESRL